MRLSPGDQVDRYVLEKQLGEGGQGEVWRARDPLSDGKIRALKLVRVASTGAAQLERVRREARQLVQLQHPSLVECVAMFEDLHRELLGIVMEFVDAQPLDELIDDPRFDERTRLHLLAHVAQALAYVHQRDVVHRDVKLENVLVTRGFWAHPDDPATVKLIDFGIAVQAANPNPLTLAGHIIGTPPYLAPELLSPGQWGGGSGASAPADVFAFGILAWKLLAGDAEAHPTQLPPRARLEEYAAAYWRAKGGQWPGAPARAASRWASLLERAVALHPRDRAQDGLDLLKAVAVVDPDVVVRTAEETAPTPLLGSAAIEPRPTSGFTEPQTVNVNVTPRPAVRTIPGEPPIVGVGGPHAGSPGASSRRSGGARWLWLVLAALGAGLVMAIVVVAGTLLFLLPDDAAPAVQRGSGPPAALSGGGPSVEPPSSPTQTCSGCERVGTVCESGRCRLAPRSRWKVRPFALRRVASTPVGPHVLCLRRMGTASWTCFGSMSQFTREVSGTAIGYFARDSDAVELTREQIELEGIDIQVKRDGEAILTDRVRRPKDSALIAGDTLFIGGLRFGMADGQIRDAHFALEYVVPE